LEVSQFKVSEQISVYKLSLSKIKSVLNAILIINFTFKLVSNFVVVSVIYVLVLETTLVKIASTIESFKIAVFEAIFVSVIWLIVLKLLNSSVDF
jgi:hypothetical protein